MAFSQMGGVKKLAGSQHALFVKEDIRLRITQNPLRFSNFNQEKFKPRVHLGGVKT